MKVAIDHNLGLIELLAANPGLDPWFPGNDRVLKLPTLHLLPPGPRKGILATVLDQPVKLGWADGELYMEVHPSLEHTKSINTLWQRRAQRIPDLDARLAEVAGEDADRIDRVLVRKTVREGSGLPVKITKPRPKPKVKKSPQFVRELSPFPPIFNRYVDFG